MSVKHKIACCIAINPYIKKICFGPDDVDFCLKSSQSRFNGQCAPRNYGKTCLQLIIDYNVIIDCKT